MQQAKICEVPLSTRQNHLILPFKSESLWKPSRDPGVDSESLHIVERVSEQHKKICS
jgi:hypothetical protein